MNKIQTTNTDNTTAKKQIKYIGIIHFVGNIISGGILGTVCVIGYLLFVRDIQPSAKETVYNIINFNTSYLIYMFVSCLLIIILIGIPMLIIGFIIWFIILIFGFIKHLLGENYIYPLSIKFLQ